MDSGVCHFFKFSLITLVLWLDASFAFAEWNTRRCTLQNAYFQLYSSYGGSNIVTANSLACMITEVRINYEKELGLGKNSQYCACSTSNNLSKTSLSNATKIPTQTELHCYTRQESGKFKDSGASKTWEGYVYSSQEPEKNWKAQQNLCEKERLEHENITSLEICSAWFNTTIIPSEWQSHVGLVTLHDSQTIEVKNSMDAEWTTKDNNSAKIFEGSLKTNLLGPRQKIILEAQYEEGKIKKLTLQQIQVNNVLASQFVSKPNMISVEFAYQGNLCRPVSISRSAVKDKTPRTLSLANCFDPTIEKTCGKAPCLENQYAVCDSLLEPYFRPGDFTKPALLRSQEAIKK